jgi:hypothetical protein
MLDYFLPISCPEVVGFEDLAELKGWVRPGRRMACGLLSKVSKSVSCHA